MHAFPLQNVLARVMLAAPAVGKWLANLSANGFMLIKVLDQQHVRIRAYTSGNLRHESVIIGVNVYIRYCV